MCNKQEIMNGLGGIRLGGLRKLEKLFKVTGSAQSRVRPTASETLFCYLARYNLNQTRKLFIY